MSLKKFTTSESVEVEEAKEQERISKELHKIGKTSAKDLTEDERRKVLDDDGSN